LEHALKWQVTGCSRNSGVRTAGYNGQEFSISTELQTRKIAIVVIGNAQWPALKPHIQRVIDAITAAKPASYTLVEIPAV
jgi:hypothetical protein